MRGEHRSVDGRSGLRRFFGVPFRSQTYRNIAFLGLAFPLGLTYFVSVTVGLSVGAGLSLTLVGIPLLLVTLLVVGYVGRVEAKLTTWLLDVEVDAPEVATPGADDDLTSVDGLTTAAGRLVASQTTWTSLVFVLLKFIFGLVAFTTLVTAVAVVGTLLSMPLLYDAPDVAYGIGAYPIDSLADAFVASLLGLGLAFVSLHLLNGLARLGGFLTEVLLEPDADSRGPGESDD
jgi:hypothetical protein